VRRAVAAAGLALLAACSGTVPGIVTSGCADVSAVQPLLPLLVAKLGKSAPFVKVAYAIVEAGCLDAPQIAALVVSIREALAKP
jgi:hypothetical protein